MARVAVAYVEVRPDLNKFGDLLEAELRKHLRGSVGRALQGEEGNAVKEGRRLGRKVGDSLSKGANEIVADHLWDATGKVAAKNLDDQVGRLDRYGRQLANRGRQRESELNRFHAEALQINEAMDKASEARRLDIQRRGIADMNQEILNGIREQEARKLDIQRRGMANMRQDILNGIKEQETAASMAADREMQRRRLAHAQMQSDILNGIKEQETAASAEAQRRLEYNKRAHAEMQQEILAGIKDEEARVSEAARARLDRFKRAHADMQNEIMGGIRDREKKEREADRKRKSALDNFLKQMQLGINLRLGQLAPVLVLVAVAAAPLAQIISSLGGGLTSLAAAATEMAAAVGIAGVSALLALGQAAGVAALGLMGFKDALKAVSNLQSKMAAGIKLTQGDINNYNEAMARLSPSAQQAVVALGRLNGGLLNVRKSIQQRMFAGVGDELLKLGRTWLPVVQAEAGKTADVLNKAGVSFFKFARDASTVGRVRSIMSNNTELVAELTKAIIPLARAGLTLVQAFQPLGIMLAHYVTDWSKSIDKSTAAAESSGRLAAVVDRMRTALAQAVRIAKNVGGGLAATFKAVLAPGRTLLTMFENLTAKWAAWAKSVQGQTSIAAWAAGAIPVLTALGGLIGDIGKMFNRLAASGDATSFVDQIRSILPPLEKLLTQLSSSNAAGAFVQGLATIGQALADLGAGGIMATALEMIGGLLKLIVSFVHSVPGMTQVITGLVFALAGLQALRFTATLTGLVQLPKLIGLLDKGTGVVKGFTMSMIGMNSATAKTGVFTMAATAVKGFINGLRIARLEMVAATGAANTLKAGVVGVTAAIEANPIGAILVGITAVATAIWAISAASSGAAEKTKTLNAELARVGAPQAAEEVGATLDGLRARLKLYTEGVLANTAISKEIAGQIAAEMVNIESSSTQMSNIYGRNIDSIVGNLRAWGVTSKVSTAEIMTAASQIIAANHGVPLSVEDMSNALAAVFGVMGKDYGAMANTFGALNQQIANGYGVVGDAALDAAEKQIRAAQLALIAVGGMGGYTAKELNAQLAGIDAYRKALAKSTAKDAGVGLGGAIDQSGAAAGGAAKKQGAKTAAGFITSFTAQISELKASDLFKHSATWTAVGMNISTYLAKGMTSGAKNINNVAKYISKQFGKTYVTQIQKEIAKYRKALTVFDPATGKQQGQKYWEDRLTEIRDFKQQAYDALTSGADLVNYFGFIPTPGEVQGRLNNMLATMRKFTDGLGALQTKGLSKELSAAWLQAGYDTAGNLVEGLQDATPDQIKEINKTYQTITDEAKKTSDAQATKYYGIGEAKVVSIINGIKSNTAKLEASINTLMTQALNAAKKGLNWTKLGEDAMNAYNSGISGGAGGVSGGLNSTFANIQKGAVKTQETNGKALAKAMLDGYNKALADQSKTTHDIIQAVLKGDYNAARNILKAQSPSKLYYELGVDTMTGYQLGIASMQSAVTGTVADLYGAVTGVPATVLPAPTVARPAYAMPGTAGYPTGVPQQPINVRVYVGDREITDIVRTEVDGYDSTRARALLAGRRGG